MKLGLYFTPVTKINLKWIKDLNMRPDTTELLEEKTGEKLVDIGLGCIFLDLTPRAKATKAKTNKWDHIKLKRKQPSKGKVPCPGWVSQVVGVLSRYTRVVGLLLSGHMRESTNGCVDKWNNKIDVTLSPFLSLFRINK